ncbi:response regulator transcription factor [Paraburkholderia sediminicola]|uniref:Response regulator transcription factor n=1 Tax=Paraburkholderia metrosideri TaxID=580937 RepID=A0ABW9DTQ5_9BURK
MNSTKIRLVLADDHPTLIAGIRYALADIPTIDIVGTARNSTEILELLSRVRCDILVTDYAMPGGEYGDGLTLLSFLRRRFSDLKIIVFTTVDNPAMIREITQLGIASVVNKVDDAAHLVSAIHAVYAGATYVSPAANREPLQNRVRTASTQTTVKLTPREAEVVRLYVSGMSVNEIADQLHRTKQTVSSQKSSAMRKLGIERDADLFRFAYETGLAAAAEPKPT